MSITFAVLAGALAMLNPCSFALLPAFLSLYASAADRDLPTASTRTVQAVLAGLTVAVGAVSIFAVVGVPIALGAGQLAVAVPWVGFALGAALAAFAVLTLSGKRIPLPDRGVRLDRQRRRGLRTMLLFGAGYGVASLSCTLPIFLVVIGASLTTQGGLAALVVFAGYALGMAVVLAALAVGAALLRDGVARTFTRLLPHLRWVNGGLLLAVGAYLLYYWGTALFSSTAARAHDPVVSFTERVTTQVQSWANSGGGQWLLVAAAGIVALALLRAVWRWARTDATPHDDPATDSGDIGPVPTGDQAQGVRGAR